MTDILEHMKWRYAVKKFDAEKILPDEKVEGLKKAFNLTATSYGLQPITMLVIKNKTLQHRLVQHSFDQPQVSQASHVLIICVTADIDGRYIAQHFEQIKRIRGVSDEILDPFKDALVDDFSKKDKKEIKEWCINQAYLAMGNLLTVCAIEKIDSCPMEGFDPDAYDELLNLKEKGLTSVLVLPIGYRAEDDIFADFKKVRKNLNESVIDIS